MDYRKQAQNEYDAKYNADVQAMKNNLAQNLLQLDQSKTGVNQNFDTQVEGQNRMNIGNKNNLSNTMLGRGLGRSSIVGTGLGEADQINTRKVGEINTLRTGALNDVEQRKTMLNQQSNDALTRMAGDRESSIMALARQLEDRDRSYNLELQRLALQKANSANSNDKPYNEAVTWINDLVSRTNDGRGNELSSGDKMTALQNYYRSLEGQEGDYVQKLKEYVSKQMGSLSGNLSADRYNAIPTSYAPGVTARKGQSVQALDEDYYKNLLNTISGR